MRPVEAGGLRDRKKARTRLALIETALRLFLEQGFEQTPIEDIAAAAEVAPRTVFRYFATKEDLVFVDQADEDARLAAALRTRQAGESDLDFISRALAAALVPSARPGLQLAQLEGLVQRTPSLQSRAVLVRARWEQLIGDALLAGGKRTRVRTLRARVLAACTPPAVMAALRTWEQSGRRGPAQTTVREALQFLRDGFE